MMMRDIKVKLNQVERVKGMLIKIMLNITGWTIEEVEQDLVEIMILATADRLQWITKLETKDLKEIQQMIHQ